MPNASHRVESEKAAPEPVFAIFTSVFFVAVAEAMLSMRFTRFFNPGLEIMIVAVAMIHLKPIIGVFSRLSKLMKAAFFCWFAYLVCALVISVLRISV